MLGLFHTKTKTMELLQFKRKFQISVLLKYYNYCSYGHFYHKTAKMARRSTIFVRAILLECS